MENSYIRFHCNHCRQFGTERNLMKDIEILPEFLEGLEKKFFGGGGTRLHLPRALKLQLPLILFLPQLLVDTRSLSPTIGTPPPLLQDLVF